MKPWWNDKFEDHGTYMESYGEGVGSKTRQIIFSFIDKNDSVLDVGCGPGWNYEHGREHEDWQGEYKGTDYASKFVEACQAKYPGVAFEVQDCRNLEESDNSWDVVVLQDVLEHTNGYVKPIVDALAIARRKVIITFWRHLSETQNDDIKQSDPEYDGYCAQYSKPKLFDFLNSLGYKWEYLVNDDNRFHEFLVINKEESL